MFAVADLGTPAPLPSGRAKAYGARTMLRLSDLALPLDHAPAAVLPAIAARLGVSETAVLRHTLVRRGNDARKRGAIKLVYSFDVELADEAEVAARLAGDAHVRPAPDTAYRFPTRAPEGWQGPRPVVIGAGPCGLLAALVLAQMGFKPIIIERGKAVRERTKDTWALWRQGVLEPESNAQFGEGGAGTFSDGKLYSRIKDPRHLGRKVLEEFVKAGAPPDILTEAHPHVGTFRLVTMVMSLRAAIEALGGEYRFGTRVDAFERTDGAITALHLSSSKGGVERLEAQHPDAAGRTVGDDRGAGQGEREAQGPRGARGTRARPDQGCAGDCGKSACAIE